MVKAIKYSNKYAKEIMKKYNLHWEWDSDINYGDIQCFCGEWFSNPVRGRVRQTSNGTEVNGICVEKVPFEDWFGPTGRIANWIITYIIYFFKTDLRVLVEYNFTR